mmetsp:Transcript_10632/g.15555  ORF Transcript_10632/g.15555 Transcript_10632/m.15555 type:complete len:116 (-) Transcript_10632:375-722(-)|eukprot:CAMPEP_0195526068 /NCGR_PEP_ID=MMETSP0794_2-20130614/26918_1 /TAXON_ID=515487 /ORGANISM="Stephanopyxis turris, Strain CCMP 815" /LENGTH=115 /DNA_ID=CAMNT_0040656681 /DNA_START=153 /DNA_END=500 /DNA_ORIENTATION=+
MKIIACSILSLLSVSLLLTQTNAESSVRHRVLEVNAVDQQTPLHDTDIAEIETHDAAQGPWPECVGMQFDDCENLILSVAEDAYVVQILPHEDEHTRVWIMVNETNHVYEVPTRG